MNVQSESVQCSGVFLVVEGGRGWRWEALTVGGPSRAMRAWLGFLALGAGAAAAQRNKRRDNLVLVQESGCAMGLGRCHFTSAIADDCGRSSH